MNKTSCFRLACIVTTVVWTGCPAFGQGDPVPPPPTPPPPTPVQAPVETGPSFFQIIQQQQQNQNILNSLQFPSYLQANPTITPLDQLPNKTSKYSVPIAPGMSLTISVPNIKNSILLSPSKTQVTAVQTQKTTTPTPTNSTPANQTITQTTAVVNQKPSFNSLGPLLDSLSKQANTTTTNTATNSTPNTTQTTTATTTSNINQKPSFDGLNTLLTNLANANVTKTISDLAPTYFKDYQVVNIVVELVESKNIINKLEPKLESLRLANNNACDQVNAAWDKYDKNRTSDNLKEYQRLSSLYKLANSEFEDSAKKVADAKAKVIELTKQAPAAQANAIKTGFVPPKDLPVVVASSKELENGAVEMTKKISDLLFEVDLAASQIKFMEVTNVPQSSQESLKKDMAYSASLVKFTWTMLQRKPELMDLVSYKLKQSNLNDLFVKVLNSPSSF